MKFVGDYAGFDEKEPTSKNGGKAEVISMLKEKYGYSKLFMIGDGITDLEACPPADAFIGKFPNFGQYTYIVLNSSQVLKNLVQYLKKKIIIRPIRYPICSFPRIAAHHFSSLKLNIVLKIFIVLYSYEIRYFYFLNIYILI